MRVDRHTLPNSLLTTGALVDSYASPGGSTSVLTASAGALDQQALGNPVSAAAARRASPINLLSGSGADAQAAVARGVAIVNSRRGSALLQAAANKISEEENNSRPGSAGSNDAPLWRRKSIQGRQQRLPSISHNFDAFAAEQHQQQQQQYMDNMVSVAARRRSIIGEGAARYPASAVQHQRGPSGDHGAAGNPSPPTTDALKRARGESFVGARRSSNIGLLLNPVDGADSNGSDRRGAKAGANGTSSDEDYHAQAREYNEQAYHEQQQQQQQDPNAPPTHRRGAISAAPDYRGPTTDDARVTKGAPPSFANYAGPVGIPGQAPRGMYTTTPDGRTVPSYAALNEPRAGMAYADPRWAGAHLSPEMGKAGGLHAPAGLGHELMDGVDLMGRRRVVSHLPRQFKCNSCPASFARNHDLRRHARIHLAVKPFACNDCGKPFSRKDALKRHILVKGCGGRSKKRRSKNADSEKKNASSAAAQQEDDEDEMPMAKQQQHQAQRQPNGSSAGVSAAPAHHAAYQQTPMGYPGMPAYGYANGSMRPPQGAPGQPARYDQAPGFYMSHLAQQQQQQEGQANGYPAPVRRVGTMFGHETYMDGQQQQQQQHAHHQQGGDMQMMHDANRARAATFDSVQRPNFISAMWDYSQQNQQQQGQQQQQQQQNHNGQPMQSPTLSTQSSNMQYGQQDNATAATLLSPAFVRPGLHGSEMAHFSPVMAGPALLTREERRASLTRASSEYPTLPSAGNTNPATMGSFYPGQQGQTYGGYWQR